MCYSALAYANFRKPKAQRSLEFSEKLIEAGLHSPKPIGYIVTKHSMQIHQSFYIQNIMTMISISFPSLKILTVI